MYSQSITRHNRTLFVLCIDESGSMAEMMALGGRTITKAQMLSEVANTIIAELIERSRRSDGVRDYYDVAIIGYSGDGVHSHFGAADFVSIAELAAMEVPIQEIWSEFRGADGSLMSIREYQRCWVTPVAAGQTPMYEALSYIHDFVKRWCAANPDSFPPTIYNITDGQSTDCNYSDICDVAHMIKSLATRDGNPLLFNIHINSNNTGGSLLFPAEEEMEPYRRLSHNIYSLYESSSKLPAIFDEAICDIKGVDCGAGFKALCYNSSVAELISILNIGSISVRRG